MASATLVKSAICRTRTCEDDGNLIVSVLICNGLYQWASVATVSQKIAEGNAMRNQDGVGKGALTITTKRMEDLRHFYQASAALHFCQAASLFLSLELYMQP